MPIGRKTCEVKVLVGYAPHHRGHRGEAQAYEFEGSCPSLAFGVNQTPVIDDDGDVAYGSTWNVTHLATGYALAVGLPTRSAARAVVRAAEGLGLDLVDTADVVLARSQMEALGAPSLVARVAQAVEEQLNTEQIRRLLRETADADHRGGGGGGDASLDIFAMARRLRIT